MKFKKYIAAFLLLAGFFSPAKNLFAQVDTISQTDIGANWFSGVASDGGQSFTMPQSGYITEIRFYTYTPENVTDFNIYAGQNSTGTSLYYTSFNNTTSGWVSVPVNPALPVCEGMYTFMMNDISWAAINVNNMYTGGDVFYSGFFSPGWDMAFEVYYTINNSPAFSFAPANSSICLGGTFSPQTLVVVDETATACTITATSSNQSLLPDANISVSYTAPNATVATNVVPGVTGVSTVSLSIYDGNCTKTYTYDVEVYSLPAVSAGTDMLICSGTSITLNGGGAVSYSWNNSVSDGIPFTPPPGSTDYIVTGTDLNGCSNSDTINVFAQIPPVSNAGIDDFMCAGQNYTLNGGGSTGAISTYDWYEVGTGIIGSGVTQVVSPTANISYALYVTDGTCSDYDTMLLNVNTPGDPTFTYPVFTLCNDAPTQNPTVNTPGGSFSFTPGGLAINSTTGVIDPAASAPGTYTITYDLTTPCFATFSVSVTIYPLPTGFMSGGGNFCAGDPNAQIVVNNNSSNPWDLTFIQNGSPGASATPPSQSYVFSGLGNPVFNGVWTAIIIDNVTGCADTISNTVTLTILPEPSFGVGSPATMCENTAGFDMNTDLNPNPPGGAWNGPGVSGSNFTPGSVGPGNFNIIYTLSSGCDDTIQFIVNPVPNVSISGVNSAYCVTDPPFFPVGTPAGGVWSIDAGPFGPLTSVDPSTFSQGLHTLLYQFTDTATGCNGVTTPTGFNIYNVPLDPTTTSLLTQTVCAGASVNLNATNPNVAGGTSLAWYSDAGLTNQIATGPSFSSPPLASNTNYYVVVQNNGCKSNPIMFTITVNTAQVSAGPDLIICPGTSAQLNVTSAAGTILWSPGSSLNDSTIQNPLASPNVNTTYIVGVQSGSCFDSDTVNVILDGSNPDCGIVPSYNVFSPDGDNVNDTWIIDAVIFHPDNHVSIFNRWGDRLISFDDYDNVNVVWDGKVKNESLPSGTYFYLIEYKDINVTISGWVQITR